MSRRLNHYLLPFLAAFPLLCAVPARAAQPLRYWFWWEASSFDTYRGDAFDVMQVARNIYAPLVSIGMDGKPQGMAADDWKVDASGRTWRFHIRKGLTFEDGKPVTPGVVLANFRRLLWLTKGEKLPLNSLLPETETWSGYDKPLKSVFADGEYLVFKFRKRPENLFEVLSHPIYGIASPACFDAAGKWLDPFCSVASGQYRVAAKEPGLIRLASRHIYEAAKDAPETVEIRSPAGAGESSLKAMLDGKGELAIEPMFALSAATMKRLDAYGLRITEEPPSRMYFVQLNHKKKPFGDAALRRSVRDDFLERLGRTPYFSERGPVEPSFMPKGGVGYSILKSPKPGAPVKAPGSRIDVIFFPLATYASAEDGAMQDCAEKAFIETAKAHGLVPNIIRYTDRRDAIDRLRKGDFDAIMRGSGITVNDPYAGLKMMLMSRISAMIPDPSGRASEYIEQANESSEPALRRELAGKMNRAMFEDAAVLNFAHSSWVYIHKPGVGMSRFNLFMDPIEFRATSWKAQGE